MIDFIIYGIMDNGIMIAGALTGRSFEHLLPKHFQNGLGVVYGAGLANAFSDFIGGMTTLSYSLAFGTAIGCLIGMLFIPIYTTFYKTNMEVK